MVVALRVGGMGMAQGEEGEGEEAVEMGEGEVEGEDGMLLKVLEAAAGVGVEMEEVDGGEVAGAGGEEMLLSKCPGDPCWSSQRW